jgi:hypothetical protein
MPPQPDEVKVVIAGLKRIADSQEWPRDKAFEAAEEAWEAAADASSKAVAAALKAAYAAAWSIAWLLSDAAYTAEEWAVNAAKYAAETHPNPDKERQRQEPPF